MQIRGGGNIEIETNIFDIEELHPSCTVQILTNSATGESSIGWWENPGWTSVEDALPERDVDVLVFATGKIDGFIGDHVIAIARRCVFRIVSWVDGEETWSSPWQYFHTDYEITHWMPLPEPPTDDGE